MKSGYHLRVASQGELLSERLQRGRIPFDEAIAIARQLAATLASAHAVSMIYRNLEPASVVLSEPVTLRPPSPISHQGADRRGDVDALGCIFVDMFGVYRVLPAQLDATLAAMRATDPDARPTMADVVQQLAAFPADLANDPTLKLQAELEPQIEAKQWTAAIETIDRFLADESDSVRRGVYVHAAATIYRDELASRDDALDRYDSALDHFFTTPEVLAGPLLPYALRAFHAIEQLLGEPSDWRALDRAHRRMIVRVRGQTAPEYVRLQVQLFDRLAEIYRAHDSAESAISALEVADGLEPGNPARAALLAQLRVAR